MKRFELVLFVLFVTGICLAQKWEVTLTSGQTYSPVKLNSLLNDSLQFQMTSSPVSVPLETLASIKLLKTRRLRLWGFTGGVVGFSCGYFVGSLFGKIFDLPLKRFEDPVVLFPTTTGIVLGAVLGLDHARESAKTNPAQDYDFSQLSREEKKITIQRILQRRNQ